MTDLIKKIQIILSTKSILPEIPAELILELSEDSLWRFYYAPSLKLEKIESKDLKNFKVCKIVTSEKEFLRILNGETTQQDSYNDQLLTASGDLEQIVLANTIIDSLIEIFSRNRLNFDH